MKVKIIKSGLETYWYRDKIGEIFDVTDLPEKYKTTYHLRDLYMVTDKDETNYTNMIDIEDCEPILISLMRKAIEGENHE